MSNFIEHTFECEKCGNHIKRIFQTLTQKARHQAMQDFHECEKCKKEKNPTDSVIEIELKRLGMEFKRLGLI
jgi:Zn finger protein HypA/HybF involved in hydrogenase expression